MGGVVVPNSHFAGTVSSESLYPNMQAASQLACSELESPSRLIAKYDRLIHFIALQIDRHGVPLDDLLQEGYIALLHAAEFWRASQGVQFWTYARKGVVREMLRLVTRERSDISRSATRDALSLESREDSGVSPETLQIHAECLAILEDEFEFLEPIEKQILQLRFVDEVDVRTVGVRLGMSKSSVDRVYQEAIVKLRNRIVERV